MCTEKIQQRGHEELARDNSIKREKEREKEIERERTNRWISTHDSIGGTFFIIVESIALPARA